MNFVKAFKMFGLSSSTILRIEQSNTDNMDKLEGKQMDDPAETSEDENIIETDRMMLLIIIIIIMIIMMIMMMAIMMIMLIL